MIYLLSDQISLLRHFRPLPPHHKRIHQDRYQNKCLEFFANRNVKALLPQIITLRANHCRFRSHSQREYLRLHPILLPLGQQKVSPQAITLVIEGGYDDAHEEIHDEKAAQYNEPHKE